MLRINFIACAALCATYNAIHLESSMPLATIAEVS